MNLRSDNKITFAQLLLLKNKLAMVPREMRDRFITDVCNNLGLVHSHIRFPIMETLRKFFYELDAERNYR